MGLSTDDGNVLESMKMERGLSRHGGRVCGTHKVEFTGSVRAA